MGYLADFTRVLLSILFISFFPAPVWAEDLCDLDIDGDGSVTVATDAMLAVGWLFGVRGDVLAESVVIGPGAIRSTGPELDAFLSLADCRIMLDVDGNQRLDPLTDGLFIIRALSGFSGNSLMVSAMGVQATRVKPEAILDHLAFYENPRVITIETDRLQAGDSITDVDGQLVLTNVGATPASVRVVAGSGMDGYPGYTIDTKGGSIDVHLPDPNQPFSQGRPNYPAGMGREGDTGWFLWDSGRAWFFRHGEIKARAPNYGPTYNISVCESHPCREGEIIDPDLFIGGWSVQSRPAFRLLSMCDPEDSECYQGAELEPVLFIHGLLVGDMLENERGTWGDWPLGLLGARRVAFQFRWSTNARFQDVAHDLYIAIKQLFDKTGKKVHLVAHSFGGVLVRALLQRIGTPEDEGAVQEFADIGNYVAGLVTLGAPLSGIAGDERTMHDIQFPRGQDTQGLFDDTVFSLATCDKLGCQQLGVDVVKEGEAIFYKVADAPGWLAAQLATTTDRLPAVDILDLIGLTIPRDDGGVIDEGDGLFSGWGQRFHPSFGVVQGGGAQYWAPLAKEQKFGAAKVTEKVLGMDSSAAPGGSSQFSVLEPGFQGYRHSIAVNGNGKAEFLVENVLVEPTLGQLESDAPVEIYVLSCTSQVVGLCADDHYGVKEVSAWIDANSKALPTAINDTGITGCADGASYSLLSCPQAGYPGQDAEYGRDREDNDDADGHAGFSFTKIAAKGGVLPASAEEWGCVKDNVTGLVWEVKTRDGGPHDEQYRFNWYNTDPASNGGDEGYADKDGPVCYGYNVNDPSTYCNTQAFVARVNAAGWCGYNDWRLPSKIELRGIVNMDRVKPSIDVDWFPHTRNSYYWTASPYAQDTTSAWSVYFNSGLSFGEGKAMDWYVRLVRDGK